MNLHTFLHRKKPAEPRLVFCRSALGASIRDRIPLRSKTVTVNVAGTTHKLNVHLKRPFLITRLLFEQDNPQTNCQPNYILWFQRPPTLFEETVLVYARTGKRLFMPDGFCAVRVTAELEFWEIPKEYWPKECLKDGELEMFYFGDVTDDDLMRRTRGHWWGDLKRKAWRFLDYPTLSRWSTFFAIVSICFVVCSVSILIMQSIPEIEESQAVKAYFNVIENICLVWFSLEYSIRLVVCPDRAVFLKNTLNIIDALAILPFFLEVILSNVGFDAATLDKVSGPILMIRLLRVARVMRVFKLARYSNSTKVVVETIIHATSELAMLGVVFLTAVTLFSTTVYFLERESENTRFTSIPAAAWWAMSTMTTIGYGDMPIYSFGGKMVAAAASICGILCLGFPISLVVKKHPAGVRRVRVI